MSTQPESSTNDRDEKQDQACDEVKEHVATGEGMPQSPREADDGTAE